MWAFPTICPRKNKKRVKITRKQKEGAEQVELSAPFS